MAGGAIGAVCVLLPFSSCSCGTMPCHGERGGFIGRVSIELATFEVCKKRKRPIAGVVYVVHTIFIFLSGRYGTSPDSMNEARRV